MKIKENIKTNEAKNKEASKAETKTATVNKTETATVNKTETKTEGNVEVVVNDKFMEAYPNHNEIYINRLGGTFTEKVNGVIKKIVRTNK